MEWLVCVLVDKALFAGQRGGKTVAAGRILSTFAAWTRSADIRVKLSAHELHGNFVDMCMKIFEGVIL
jgi:hypothetical protein